MDDIHECMVCDCHIEGRTYHPINLEVSGAAMLRLKLFVCTYCKEARSPFELGRSAIAVLLRRLVDQ